MKSRLFVVTFILATMRTTVAATITVPGDYPTIGDAYNAAHNGDEILVSPGLYTINGTFPIQKKIILRSNFDGKDLSIVKSTILKGVQNSDLISIANIPSVAGTVIQGFTLTRDPVTILPNTFISARGIVSSGVDATIEDCIIENCVYVGGQGGPPGVKEGAALAGINGRVQNNIIRNCVADGGSAMAGCVGTIQNNVIFNCPGAVASVGGYFLNNTLYESGGMSGGSGIVINDIFWSDSNTSTPFQNSITHPPRNCVIKGYTGPGYNLLDANPQFVDPANGDFHLEASSPCIDAGLTTTSTSAAKADIEGVQRGLKGVQVMRGDGSGIDIGAYEYKPKPVAVWLPNGGPDAIHAGDTLAVAWEMDPNVGGTAIDLQLWDDRRFVADFGAFYSATGAAVEQLPLTAGYLPTDTHYYILGFSSFDHTLTGQTPLMMILSLTNAVAMRDWSRYR